MDQADKQENVSQPLLRITTFGEFTLERLIPALSRSQKSRYLYLPWADISGRGTALTMLKILLCRSDRRASKEELIATIWHSSQERINTAHTLDTAASLLRRHILRTYDGESLLITSKSGGETSFKLAPQRYLWVDADAFLALASQATRAEQEGNNPLPYLEEAHALTRGEFLDEDLHTRWSQGKRLVIGGARRRVLYKLVEIYLHMQRVNQAEEILFSFLADNPTDEDALCQLMLLLIGKERRHEALNVYQYVADVLQDERREPGSYTQSLAHQIQQGLSLQEKRATYTTPGTHDLLMLPLVVGMEQGLLYKVLQIVQNMFVQHDANHWQISSYVYKKVITQHIFVQF